MLLTTKACYISIGQFSMLYALECTYNEYEDFTLINSMAENFLTSTFKDRVKIFKKYTVDNNINKINDLLTCGNKIKNNGKGQKNNTSVKTSAECCETIYNEILATIMCAIKNKQLTPRHPDSVTIHNIDPLDLGIHAIVDEEEIIEDLLHIDEIEQWFQKHQGIELKSLPHALVSQKEINKTNEESSGVNDQSVKPHGNSERYSSVREAVLGAALAVLHAYPEKCTSIAAVCKIIDEKSPLLWPKLEAPPLSPDRMERLIGMWFNKIKQKNI